MTVNGYTYYLATQNWRGIRNIYIPGIEYFRDPSGVDEHYLPTGTGETFHYYLLPGEGAEWEPDVMCLYIKDASDNYVYMRYLIGSAVNNPDIALYGYFAALEWNGLGNQGTYNGQPLPPGNYTITLYVNKSGYTAYETNPLTITVIELMGVTNATQTNVTGSKNWASVKNVGNDVIVEAFFYPTIPDAYVPYILEWEGGSPVDGNPRQRKVSKSTSDHYNVTATAGSSSDYVDIWIIWASVQIKMTGTTPANAVQFGAAYDGTENLGAKSYDGGTIAVGKVVPIGTISPPGVDGVIDSGWEFKRERWCHDFDDGVKSTTYWETSWHDDTSSSSFQMLDPDVNDQIFDRDAPNIAQFGNTDSSETYNNFRQWITWNGERASTLYAYWYWEAYWKNGESPEITYKLVIEGNLSLPDEDEAYYDPPD